MIESLRRDAIDCLVVERLFSGRLFSHVARSRVITDKESQLRLVKSDHAKHFWMGRPGDSHCQIEQLPEIADSAPVMVITGDTKQRRYELRRIGQLAAEHRDLLIRRFDI
jgi:hypothetical protein